MCIVQYFQFLPSYDSFGMMGDGLPQESNNNYNVIPNHPPPQYPTSQPMQHQQPQQVRGIEILVKPAVKFILSSKRFRLFY